MPLNKVVVVTVVAVALVERDVPDELSVLNDVDVMLDDVEVADVTVDVEVGTSPLIHVQDCVPEPARAISDTRELLQHVRNDTQSYAMTEAQLASASHAASEALKVIMLESQ